MTTDTAKFRCHYCGGPTGLNERNCSYCGCGNPFYKEPWILRMAIAAMGSIGTTWLAKSAFEYIKEKSK